MDGLMSMTYTYCGHDIISNLHHSWIISWIDDPRRKSNFHIFCWTIILGKAPLGKATQGLFWKSRCVVKFDLSSAKKTYQLMKTHSVFFKIIIKFFLMIKANKLAQLCLLTGVPAYLSHRLWFYILRTWKKQIENKSSSMSY